MHKECPMIRSTNPRSRGHVIVLILLGYVMVMFMGFCDMRTAWSKEVIPCDAPSLQSP
jgi:hypothetical protein